MEHNIKTKFHSCRTEGAIDQSISKSTSHRVSWSYSYFWVKTALLSGHKPLCYRPPFFKKKKKKHSSSFSVNESRDERQSTAKGISPSLLALQMLVNSFDISASASDVWGCLFLSWERCGKRSRGEAALSSFIISHLLDRGRVGTL